MIFACCHPVLEEKSRIALILRILCGLSTLGVAAVFLNAEPTMGQHLSRAKAKILAAGILFAVPGPEDWPERLNSVLNVVYRNFTAGYVEGAAAELCGQSLFLTRLSGRPCPEEPEVQGCLGLSLLTHACASARISPEGQPLPPRVRTARFKSKPCLPPFYARLLGYEPAPIIRLNYADALAKAGHLAVVLHVLDALADPLAEYQFWHAARAEHLGRSGNKPAGFAARARAIALATSPANMAFLAQKRDSVDDAPGPGGQSLGNEVPLAQPRRPADGLSNSGKKKAELSLGQVQQGGTRQRKHRLRRLEPIK